MKSGKFLFLAIIFLVSLVCISAVSAADEAVSDVIADTNDETVLQESIDDDDLGDSKSVELEESDKDVVSADEASSVDPPSRGSFKKLNDDVNNGADVVYLSLDYDYVADYDSGFENGIEISRNVTIYGNGHTINGNHKASIFTIPANYTVIFKDINFVNANATYNGGAICRTHPSNVTAVNCTFTGNYAGQNGGAAQGIKAVNCTFTNNTAYLGGGAMFGGKATNCIFIGNSAGENGGAIDNVNGLGAVDCTFIGNSATNGGAISYCDAINCTFTKNTASETGGAMYHYVARNCTFTNNTAEREGGAIESGVAIDCNFTANTASSGGAIAYGTATGCTFTENIAGVHGGAIYEGNATNSNFKSNKALSDGGAIYNSWDSDNYAVNCTFINNKAVNGGAMIFGQATNCIFIGNRASYNGGALDNTESTNCNFTNNYAANEGGAIYSSDPVKNCIFTNNSANYGGAIQGSVNIENCTFISNSANIGGALNGCIAVTNCTFIGNSAKLEGDDVYSTDTENSKFFTPTTVSSKAVSTTYNVNKYLVITLKDFKSKPMSGVYVTVTLSGTKKYKTDKNGQIKINVAKLVPKTYTAKISFAANGNYLASSTTAKVTVKKAAVKLTAKAKTFRVKVKTKKYTVTLKNNKNKVLKKVKLTLRVGKKTYKATTNSKGKATFKITKLTKRGKYTATIKFAGSKYYNKLTKKVKITVKK